MANSLKIKKYKLLIILCSSLVLLAIPHYFNLLGSTIDALLFYFILPAGIIVFIFDENIQEYGIRWGNVRTGVILTMIGIVLSLLVTFLASKYIMDIQLYYSSRVFSIQFIIKTILYMFAWEFMFRGYLLFGLKKYFGGFYANVIQTLFFFIVHVGKPAIEMQSTIFSGLIFGYICLKSKSFWPMVIIHSVIMISIVFFASL